MSYKTINYVTHAGYNCAASTSFSGSFTVAEYPDSILIVTIATRGGTCSNVQYGGEAMTLAKQYYYDSHDVEIWYKVRPKLGTNNITASVPNNDRGQVGAIHFYNVHQTSPVNATYQNAISGRSSTINCNSIGVDDCIAVDSIYHASSTLGSPNAGQNVIKTRGTEDACGSTYEMDIDTASEAMGWSGFIEDTGAHIVAVFQPSKRKGAFIFNSLLSK